MMRSTTTLGLCIAILLLSVVASGQETKDPATKESTPTIFFVCEHGAAKSVIAAAYFNKLAKERGLKYRAVFRGTNPDSELASAAVKGLREDGIDTQGWKPTLITKQEMEAASAIITLGCALPGKNAVAAKVSEWNETPPVGESYADARDYIVSKVRTLTDELQKAAGDKNRSVKPQP